MPKRLRFHGIVGYDDGSTLGDYETQRSQTQTVCGFSSQHGGRYEVKRKHLEQIQSVMLVPTGEWRPTGGGFVVHILQSSITFLNHALRMFYINSRSITEMKIMSRQESPRIYDLGGRIDFGISDKFGITGGRMTQGWIILSNNGWLHVFTSSENRIHLEPKGRRHGVSNGLFGGAIWRIVAI